MFHNHIILLILLIVVLKIFLILQYLPDLVIQYLIKVLCLLSHPKVNVEVSKLESRRRNPANPYCLWQTNQQWQNARLAGQKKKIITN
uniref:Secreted protein n=1 Tax=Acrobeloides nanus TaxID=290746 RepID=A0A914CK66_9BILA